MFRAMMGIAALAIGCGTPEDPPLTPPMATGIVCVDVDTAGATITLGETVVTERCTELTDMYRNRTMLKVTAPGHKPYEAEVAPIGTETLQITLEPIE